MEDLQYQIHDLQLQINSLFDSLTELQRQNIVLLTKIKEMEDFWYED